jgi:hypothetical protein
VFWVYAGGIVAMVANLKVFIEFVNKQAISYSVSPPQFAPSVEISISFVLGALIAKASSPTPATTQLGRVFGDWPQFIDPRPKTFFHG